MRRFVLVLAAVLPFAACKSGGRDDGGSDVLLVNATVTTPDHAVARSTVMIGRKSGKLCSGTLLHPRLVLTAAHCVDNLVLEDEPTSVLFALNVSAGADTPMVKVEKFFRHKNYAGVPTTSAVTPVYDLAVLILAEDAPAPYAPAALPAANVPVAFGEQLLLAGAGLTDPNDQASSTVMHHKAFRVTNVALQRGELEFLPVTPGGACGGDSGGPAYKVVDGKLIVLGVASRVVNGCMSTAYYSDTRAFHNWIKQFETDVNGTFKYYGEAQSGPGSPFKLGVNIEVINWNNETWVRFKAVTPGGPASLQGIQPGDLVKRINDTKIYNEQDFDAAVAAALPTGKIRIKFMRFIGNSASDGEAVIPVPAQ